MNRSLKLYSLQKNYAASFGIATILFLWPIQVFYKNVGVPLYIILSVFFIIFSRFTMKNILSFFIGTLFLLILLFFQKMQGVVLTTPLRSILAIPVFVFVFVCASRWIDIIKENNQRILFFVFRLFFIAQVLIQLCQLVAWKTGFYTSNYTYLFDIPRVSGFFSEPSHVAFSLSPFIYLIFFHRKLACNLLGKLGVTCLVLTFIMCPSSTLVGIAAMVLFFLQIRSFKSLQSFIVTSFLVLCGCGFLSCAIIYIPAVAERVLGLFQVIPSTEGIKASTNNSVLLFVKGWQMALAGLQHYFIGVGFLNFQFLNEYSPVSFLNDFLYEKNALEGTSTGFKIIGEYGYIGLIIVVYTFWSLLKNICKKDVNHVLENFFIFGLLASFMRGASYIDGVPLIGLVILYKKSINPSIRMALKGFQTDQ